MLKTSAVREMSAEQLDKKLADLKNELFNLRFQHSTSQLDNPMRLVEVRKDIARVKTILREKELTANK